METIPDEHRIVLPAPISPQALWDTSQEYAEHSRALNSSLSWSERWTFCHSSACNMCGYNIPSLIRKLFHFSVCFMKFIDMEGNKIVFTIDILKLNSTIFQGWHRYAVTWVLYIRTGTGASLFVWDQCRRMETELRQDSAKQEGVEPATCILECAMSPCKTLLLSTCFTFHWCFKVIYDRPYWECCIKNKLHCIFIIIYSDYITLCWYHMHDKLNLLIEKGKIPSKGTQRETQYFTNSFLRCH